MAVNDNDRVTTRRLKEFWQLAKTWVQNFVSDEIDTSEETMSSTMDTKIRAAKPDYTKPNINGQIGVGLGYNDVDIKIQALSSNSNKIALLSRFQALPYPMNTALISALNNAQQAATNAPEFKKTYLKYMQGKMVVFPAQMDITPTEDNPQFKEWIKSTYSEENGKPYLTSPVYHYTESETEHTIQTRLTHHTTGDYIAIEHKIDDGAWSNSGMNGFLIAIHSLQNGMFAIGAGTIPNGSITQQHFTNSSVTNSAIASNAVTSVKIASSAVTEQKISDAAVSKTKLANKVRETIPYFTFKTKYGTNVKSRLYYSEGMSSPTYPNKVLGITIEGDCSELIKPYTTDASTLNAEIMMAGGNNHFAASRQYTFGATKPFALPTSGLNMYAMNEYGFAFLKTTNGSYFTAVEISWDADWLYMTLLDNELLNHISDTDAFLVIKASFPSNTTP